MLNNEQNSRFFKLNNQISKSQNLDAFENSAFGLDLPMSSQDAKKNESETSQIKSIEQYSKRKNFISKIIGQKN